MKTDNKTLLIDCGNTYLKWCVFDGEGLSEQQNMLHKDASVLEEFKELIDSQHGICASILMVSVLGEVFLAGAKRMADDVGMSLQNVSSQNVLAGIKNAYAKPENLGSDRLVAMVGAYSIIDDLEACIVVDSGTATTIDAVSEKGQHLGGVIFPGLELSLNSLSTNTQQLPKLEADDEFHLANGLATSTTQAIASGCLLSLASAIDGICNKMQRQLEVQSNQASIKVKRMLCGGAAKTLLLHLEGSYEHYDNLVMLGLKQIKISDTDTTKING